MKYPITNTKARRSVVIPDLAGGMNLRESLSEVNDNQMTDCKNMWFKDGMLRTRPAIAGTSTAEYLYKFDVSDNMNIAETRLFDQIEYIGRGRVSEDTMYNLLVVKLSENNRTHFHLLLVSAEDDRTIEFFGRFVKDNGNAYNWIFYDYYSNDVSYMAYKFGQKAYFLVNCNDEVFDIYELDFLTGGISLLTEKDVYTPLIATNCQSMTESPYGPGGTLIEGYNLLSRYYKSEYTISNSDGVIGITSYLLHFPLFKEDTLELYDYAENATITVKITLANGQVATHSVTLKGDGHGKIDTTSLEESSVNKNDGVRLCVYHNGIRLASANSDWSDNSAMIKMEVTAPCENSVDNKRKIFDMTQSIWFGGGAQGIYGGSRLFLGGNTNESEKALVVWSDVNKPLYFSENTYTYVGDKTQAVTAFGKQSNALVIFKEREIYQTEYVRNDSVTAEAVMNQSVIDLAAQAVTFPMTQIHGYIGCDCPNTVQLCRNRLVWANSSGKVYTLTSQTNYNERSVYEVSQMIEQKLRTENWIAFAHAVDYDDYYMLFVGNTVYVMDYNCYGYTHIASYSKSDDANIHIPWYYWELPFAPEVILCSLFSGLEIIRPSIFRKISQKKALILKTHRIADDTGAEIDTDYDLECIREDEEEDLWKVKKRYQPIESMIQTKLFDFGATGYYKNVDRVSFSLGNNGGAPIKVIFVTDNGTEQDEILLDCDETESYTPGYIKSVSRFPCLRSVLRFGVMLSCDGQMAVDGITLTYRILGGIR